MGLGGRFMDLLGGLLAFLGWDFFVHSVFSLPMTNGGCRPIDQDRQTGGVPSWISTVVTLILK